jgi:hypothetical protein
MPESKQPKTPEPMWPVLLVLLATGGLFFAMPEVMAVGPRWALVVLVAGLLLPAEICHAMGKHLWCRILGYVVVSVITLALISSVVLLVLAITQRTLPPVSLLVSAVVLWVTNIVAFAIWYWRLDAGGPHKRNMRDEYTTGAFLFPQMTIEGPTDSSDETQNWSPIFVDYLFLAFNTSTALSPTDVPVLSRWAKVMMMVQSVISLTVVALLAARAVNVL